MLEFCSPVVSQNSNGADGRILAGQVVGKRVGGMSFSLPTHLFLGILAGWLNRHQQAVIEYLKTKHYSSLLSHDLT